MSKSNTQSPILEIDNLSISFFTRLGEIPAVMNFSCVLEQGKALGLVGESGCGKSTVALGIMQDLGVNGSIVGGSIKFKGRELNNMPQNELAKLRGSEIAMIYQEPMASLNPAMKISKQLMEVPMIHANASELEAWALALEVVKDVGLPDPERILNSYPHQLSGGQQQRVALARALIFDPLVLLLDEPLGALDKKLRSDVQTQLKHLHRKVGKTFVYVTHDQEEALSMSDRVVILNHGRVIQVGSPQELYERPSTVFASRFIGKSNILRGVVNQVNGNEVVYAIAGKYFQQLVLNENFSNNDEIILALRPEKIKIVRSKVGSN